MEPTPNEVFEYLGRIGFSLVDSQSKRIYSLSEWNRDLRHTPLHVEIGGQVIYVEPNWEKNLNGAYLLNPNRRTASAHVRVRSIDNGFDLKFRDPVFNREIVGAIQNYSEIYLGIKGIHTGLAR